MKTKPCTMKEIPAKQPSLFNWGEVSRTLANTRSAITESGRGHKKHSRAIQELETFELLWKERFGKRK